MQAFLKKTRKISNKQPNLPPKRIRKRRTKPKVSRRKEIIKIREEVNKIEILKKRNDYMGTKQHATKENHWVNDEIRENLKIS